MVPTEGLMNRNTVSRGFTYITYTTCIKRLEKVAFNFTKLATIDNATLSIFLRTTIYRLRIARIQHAFYQRESLFLWH
jgi:hypothetical protein